jgi:glycosyltransferase involved in cell wall biosynthesis
MFHEVCIAEDSSAPLKYKLLRDAQVLMARTAATNSERVFVTIPAWSDTLSKIVSRPVLAEELPVPSNLPLSVEPHEVLTLRKKLGITEGKPAYGYFGTCPEYVRKILTPVLQELLTRNACATAVLIGPGCLDITKMLTCNSPELVSRIIAPGTLPDYKAALHIAASDLMLYPFPDGISGRRTSFLASLALGKPIIGSSGHLTEPFWAKSQSVVLVDPFTMGAMVSAAEELVLQRDRQAELMTKARTFYKEKFAVELTISALRR